MKKIMIICMLSAMMLAVSVKATNYLPVNTKPNPEACFSVWIKLTLIFHRPKTNCKTGFGICLDVDWGVNGPSFEGGCTSQLRFNNTNQLELLVNEEDLKNCENGYALPNFKSGTFTLEEPYTFSERVSNLLGSTTPVKVNAGNYPVIYNPAARTYLVTFTQ